MWNSTPKSMKLIVVALGSISVVLLVVVYQGTSHSIFGFGFGVGIIVMTLIAAATIKLAKKLLNSKLMISILAAMGVYQFIDFFTSPACSEPVEPVEVPKLP